MRVYYMVFFKRCAYWRWQRIALRQKWDLVLYHQHLSRYVAIVVEQLHDVYAALPLVCVNNGTVCYAVVPYCLPQ